jgi:DnaJ-class molecular chaperone
MKPFDEHERSQMFDALRVLRDATNVRVVTAADILALVQRKLNERKQGQPGTRPFREQQEFRGKHQPTNHNGQKHHNQPRKFHSGFQPQQSGYVTIECAYCHGLGYWSSRACPICRGAKSISVPRDFVECGNCYGLARWGNEDPCQTCKGLTRVKVPRFK